LDVQTRGPEAFERLTVSLMVTGHLDLVKRLLPDVDLRTYFVEHVEGAVPQVQQGYCRYYFLPSLSKTTDSME